MAFKRLIIQYGLNSYFSIPIEAIHFSCGIPLGKDSDIYRFIGISTLVDVFMRSHILLPFLADKNIGWIHTVTHTCHAFMAAVIQVYVNQCRGFRIRHQHCMLKTLGSGCGFIG